MSPAGRRPEASPTSARKHEHHRRSSRTNGRGVCYHLGPDLSGEADGLPNTPQHLTSHPPGALCSVLEDILQHALVRSKLDEALSMIDQNLSDLQGRELVSASEVADLLLDLRMLLTLTAPDAPVEVAPVS